MEFIRGSGFGCTGVQLSDCVIKGLEGVTGGNE
jgi:hypothetical protein